MKLINRMISTGEYPENLKLTKIVPIVKKDKLIATAEGWHPINIVNGIAKIVEKVLFKQIVEHLEEHKMIKHGHHGGTKRKSTQTLVVELYNELLENKAEGEDIALILMDQSKAFKIIDHKILLDKLEAIGVKNKDLDLMTNYLRECKQYVHVAGHDSDRLLVGPRGITQGSTLACVLFLIYIMDIVSVFNQTSLSPEEEATSSANKAKTYIDDMYLLTKKGDHENITEAIKAAIVRIEHYAINNKLSINTDKTEVLLVSKDNDLKNNFEIEFGGKLIRHCPKVTVLGNIFNDILSWKDQVRINVIPGLHNRARMIRYTSQYMNSEIKLNMATAIFKSKLLFGIESWGGTTMEDINKIQKIQNNVINDITKDKMLWFKTIHQKHAAVKWLSVKSEILMSTHKMTFNVLNNKIPEVLATKMKINNSNNRIGEHRKLGVKPKWLTKKLLYSNCFQACAYIYNTLPKDITTAKTANIFKKKIKLHMLQKNEF